MAKYLLASVGTFTGLNPEDGSVMFESKSLTEQSISFQTSENEIKGGFLNSLLSSYYSDSTVSVNLTDALFSFEALSMNLGSAIESDGSQFTIEQHVCADKSITLDHNVNKIGNLSYIAWWKTPTETEWHVAHGSEGSPIVGADEMVNGETYCVKYANGVFESITIPASFAPKSCYGIMTLPLFKCTEGGSDSAETKIGDVIVEFPALQFSGNLDLSLTSAGNSTMPLQAKALKVFDNAGCGDADGYYGKITKVIYNQDAYADAKAIVIANSNIELDTTDTYTLEVMAIFNSAIKAPRKIKPSELIYTIAGTHTSIAINGGIITTTSATAGSYDLEVSVAGHDNLVATAVITVA